MLLWDQVITMAQPVKPKIKSSSSSRTSQAQRAGCMQIICKIFSISLLCLVAFCIIRAYILYPYPKLPEPCDQQSDHQAITIETGIVDRFRSALTYKTISWSAGNYNRDELVRFREFIQKCNVFIQLFYLLIVCHKYATAKWVTHPLCTCYQSIFLKGLWINHHLLQY